MDSIKFNRLVRKIKHSKKAAETLYEFYYPLIVLHINRCFHGKLNGSDVAHQSFIKLFSMEFDEYINVPLLWVYQLAYNTALEILRKDGRREEAERKSYFPDVLTEETDELLSYLPERNRKVVYLCYWEKYRLIEIAEILKMTYYEVRKLHDEAKKILKNKLEREKQNEENKKI